MGAVVKNTSVHQWKLFARTLCESSLSPTPMDDASSQRHAPFAKAWRYTPSLSTRSVQCLSHQRQVWKIKIRAAWAIGSHELRFMHATCLWRTQGEKRTAFCPFCKGKMPTKTTREKRTAFCPSPMHKNYPEILQSRSGFLSTLCGALSPSLGPLRDQRGMGQHSIPSLPLPWTPSGSTGYGAFGGRKNT